MTIADDIKVLQAEIAKQTELKRAAVQRYVDEHVTDLSTTTQRWLSSQHMLSREVDELFSEAETCKAPTGWKALLLEQSKSDKARTAKLLEAVKAQVATIAFRQSPFAPYPEHDAALVVANARLSELARRSETERLAAAKAAAMARPAPLKAVAPAKLPARKQTTAPTTSRRHTPAQATQQRFTEVTTTTTNDDGVNLLIAANLLNSFNDSRVVVFEQQPPVIVSGGGGDYGGGGATGSWVEEPAQAASAPVDDNNGSDSFS